MFSSLIDFVVKPAVFTASMGLIDLDEDKQYTSYPKHKMSSRFKYYQANPKRLDNNTEFYHSVLNKVYKDLQNKDSLMELSKEELIQKYSEFYLDSNKFLREIFDCFKEHKESK